MLSIASFWVRKADNHSPTRQVNSPPASPMFSPASSPASSFNNKTATDSPSRMARRLKEVVKTRLVRDAAGSSADEHDLIHETPPTMLEPPDLSQEPQHSPPTTVKPGPGDLPSPKLPPSSVEKPVVVRKLFDCEESDAVEPRISSISELTHHSLEETAGMTLDERLAAMPL